MFVSSLDSVIEICFVQVGCVSDIFTDYADSWICALAVVLLTHFKVIFQFYTPWKRQKTSDFQMFQEL